MKVKINLPHEHKKCSFTSLSEFSLNTLSFSLTMISQNMMGGGADL